MNAFVFVVVFFVVFCACLSKQEARTFPEKASGHMLVVVEFGVRVVLGVVLVVAGVAASVGQATQWVRVEIGCSLLVLLLSVLYRSISSNKVLLSFA